MPNDTVELTVPQGEGKEPLKVQVPMSVIAAAVSETHVPKDKIETDLNRRVNGIIKNGGYRKLDEMLADDTVVQQIAEKHGLVKKGADKTGDEAVAQAIRDAVAKALGEVETKTIKPMQEKAAKDNEQINGLLRRDLQRAILQAGQQHGIRPELLKALIKGKASPFVALIEDEFGYDEEGGEFYLSDGKEGFVYSSAKDSTYKGVDEFVSEFVADAANADWVVPQGQGGAKSGSGNKGGGKQPGEIWLTQAEASDGATFTDALKKVGGDYTKVKIRGVSDRM